MAQSSCSLRAAALAVSTAIPVGIIAVPLLNAAGRPEGIALHAAFRVFCHQQAERSWMLCGELLPVCVRCLGFYAGAFAAAAGGAKFSSRLLVPALATLLITWAAEQFDIATIPPLLRWASGFLLAVAAVPAVAASENLPQKDAHKREGAFHGSVSLS